MYRKHDHHMLFAVKHFLLARNIIFFSATRARARATSSGCNHEVCLTAGVTLNASLLSAATDFIEPTYLTFIITGDADDRDDC